MADFKLGRLKFKWRGDWATSTGYAIDDIVKYGGNSYVCIQNHTSPNNENLFYTSPGTYTNYWQLHGESFYFKGSYANATWYKLNDVVSYGGKQYRTTTAHTSSSAVLDQAKFEQYSDNTTTTYLINSSGDLVKRVNDGITRTAESSDTFDTFDSSQTVNSTTYQSAV